MLMILARLVRSESFWAVVKVRSPHNGREPGYPRRRSGLAGPERRPRVLRSSLAEPERRLARWGASLGPIRGSSLAPSACASAVVI